MNTAIFDDPAPIIIGASFAAAVVAAVMPSRPSTARPWFYRGRRRAPGFIRRWRERAFGADPIGADKPDWSPTGEQAQLAADLTPIELLPPRIVRPAVVVPAYSVITEDVHHGLDPIDGHLSDFADRMDALLADWAARPVPTCADRGAARARGVDMEHTGAWDIRELMAGVTR